MARRDQGRPDDQNRDHASPKPEKKRKTLEELKRTIQYKTLQIINFPTAREKQRMLDLASGYCGILDEVYQQKYNTSRALISDELFAKLKRMETVNRALEDELVGETEKEILRNERESLEREVVDSGAMKTISDLSAWHEQRKKLRFLESLVKLPDSTRNTFFPQLELTLCYHILNLLNEILANQEKNKMGELAELLGVRLDVEYIFNLEKQVGNTVFKYQQRLDLHLAVVRAAFALDEILASVFANLGVKDCPKELIQLVSTLSKSVALFQGEYRAGNVISSDLGKNLVHDTIQKRCDRYKVDLAAETNHPSYGKILQQMVFLLELPEILARVLMELRRGLKNKRQKTTADPLESEYAVLNQQLSNVAEQALSMNLEQLTLELTSKYTHDDQEVETATIKQSTEVDFDSMLSQFKTYCLKESWQDKFLELSQINPEIGFGLILKNTFNSILSDWDFENLRLLNQKLRTDQYNTSLVSDLANALNQLGLPLLVKYDDEGTERETLRSDSIPFNFFVKKIVSDLVAFETENQDTISNLSLSQLMQQPEFTVEGAYYLDDWLPAEKRKLARLMRAVLRCYRTKYPEVTEILGYLCAQQPTQKEFFTEMRFQTRKFNGEMRTGYYAKPGSERRVLLFQTQDINNMPVIHFCIPRKISHTTY
ncbi:MAG: hypothetical protein OHK0017_05360 [Patescibacteria group bacterium]